MAGIAMLRGGNLRWEDITRGNDTRECVVLDKGASDFRKDRGVKAGYFIENKFLNWAGAA